MIKDNLNDFRRKLQILKKKLMPMLWLKNTRLKMLEGRMS